MKGKDKTPQEHRDENIRHKAESKRKTAAARRGNPKTYAVPPSRSPKRVLERMEYVKSVGIVLTFDKPAAPFHIQPSKDMVKLMEAAIQEWKDSQGM